MSACCPDQHAQGAGLSKQAGSVQLGAHMHATMVEDHGHGAPVGDLPIEAGDLSLDQVHEGLTLGAHATATRKDCQRTAGTHRQPQCREL